MTPTPDRNLDRSLEQRLDGLKAANTIRTARAELKRHIRDDRTWTLLRACLRRPPRELETMKVTDLMLAGHGLGRAKVTRILKDTGIAAAKTVGGLSPRQRVDLIHALADHRARLDRQAEHRRELQQRHDERTA